MAGRKECGCNLRRKGANSLVFTCKAGSGEGSSGRPGSFANGGARNCRDLFWRVSTWIT